MDITKVRIQFDHTFYSIIPEGLIDMQLLFSLINYLRDKFKTR